MAGQQTPCEPRARVWTGPVVAADQAGRIIGGVGWTLVVLGGLSALLLLTGGDSPDMKVSDLLLAVFFAAPGGFLLNRRTSASAWVAFVVCLILALIELAALGMSLLPGGSFLLIPGLIGGVLFGALTLLSWRAIEAARFLKGRANPAVFD